MTKKETFPQISKISYLILYPLDPNNAEQAIPQVRTLKRRPYFQPVDIAVRMLAGSTMQFDGHLISIQPQYFEQTVAILDCRFEIPNALSDHQIDLVERIKQELTTRLIPADILATDMWEEYTCLMVTGLPGAPDEFVANHAQTLARFLRAQRADFTPSEIEMALSSRLAYSNEDLMIVDWDGALLLAREDDFESEIELIKIGVYQLLRYRMLDQRIDNRLQEIRKRFDRRRARDRFGRKNRAALQENIQERLTMLLDYQRIDQELLLIGDWYTAQLYRLIIDEFYLDDWKQTIENKLASLETIVQAIQDNFSVSWAWFLDIVQLVGWILLLAGYFVLFYLDTLPYFGK